MTPFTISKIENGVVFGKEVNPLGKEPKKITWLATKFVTTIEWDRWQSAESSLEEYPLTEKSGKILMGEAANRVLNKTKKPSEFVNIFEIELIGQTITGELVTENGQKKIKI